MATSGGSRPAARGPTERMKAMKASPCATHRGDDVEQELAVRKAQERPDALVPFGGVIREQ